MLPAGRGHGWLAAVKGPGRSPSSGVGSVLDMRIVSYMSPGLPAALFEAMADIIGGDLWFESGTSGPVIGDDPFADGRADLGWICATSYADRSWVAGAGVTAVGVSWVPDDPEAHGRPVYFSDLITRPGSNMSGLADLARARVGGNDAVSLSGYHALRIAAHDRGIDLAAADFVFTGGHQASIDAVIGGDLDAAVVDSVVLARRARHEPSVAALIVAERFGPWPVQPLVARADLGPGDIADVREALLAARSDPALRRALHDAALADLVPTTGADYAIVDAAMGRVGWTSPGSAGP